MGLLFPSRLQKDMLEKSPCYMGKVTCCSWSVANLLPTRWPPNKLREHISSNKHRHWLALDQWWRPDMAGTVPQAGPKREHGTTTITTQRQQAGKQGKMAPLLDTKTTSRMVPTTLQVDKVIWFKRGPRCMLVLSFYNHIDHNKRTSLDGLPVKSTKKGIKIPCDTIESTHVSKYKGPSR